MNPTYEMSGLGSEHGDKPQRRTAVNQLPFLHRETRSQDLDKSSSVVEIDSRSKVVLQELLRKTSCGK
jgi:hypothetical protein